MYHAPVPPVPPISALDATDLFLEELTASEQGSILGDPTQASLASLASERSRQTARERLCAAAGVTGLDPAEAEAFPWRRLQARMSMRDWYEGWTSVFSGYILLDGEQFMKGATNGPAG